MSEQSPTPEPHEDPAVPMNLGPTGEAGNAQFQPQPSDENSDRVQQNDGATPEPSSDPAAAQQSGPDEIANVNTPGSVADQQSELTTPVSLPGQDIEPDQPASLTGGEGLSTDPVDELSAPAEYTITEKIIDALALISHDEYLGMGDYAGCWEPDLEWYEPCDSLDLVEKEGSINVSLVQWKGHLPFFSTHGWAATYQRKHYSVPKLPAPICDAIHLPTNVTSDFTARQVFEGICGVLRGCPALSEQQCELLSFWCLATWFADQMDFIPRLTITGPRYAADLLFVLLSRVCRRAILLAGIKPATLQQIPIEEFMPTLLIRQIKPGKSASELLDASDRRQFFVACGKELRDVYCAKCVYVGDQYDVKHADNGLHIHLERNPPSAKVGYPSKKMTQHLQNRIFTYRSFYLDRFQRQAFPAPESDALLLELDMIAYRLCSVIFEDRELQGQIIDLLKTQNEQMRADRASGTEAKVLQAVLFLAHRDEQQVYARDIAAAANQIGNEHGESPQLTAEKVGHALKRLGLYTRRLGSEGRGLLLDKPTQIQAHQLSLEYDVLPVVPQCGYCHGLQSTPSEEIM